ncbi:hypothetical protein [Cupriavidus sp. TMH.W2]|uniref:hypothetical protein n=1 Tax=Cupriavidus sp. TMH.W2 TaxID=3434465 RepID=UPI003D77B182
MRDTTIDIEVKAGTIVPLRTFVIHLTSTLNGYAAQVSERLNTGELVRMGLNVPPNQEFPAHAFYRKRDAYGALLLEEVMTALNAWHVQPVGSEPPVPALVGANVVGFDMAQAVADDFTRWDPLGVADKASAVPGTARLLSRSAGGAQS